MGRYQCEMFGRFIYGDILTYEELQDVEALFVPRLEELLQQAGAAHVDFTPTGDILLVQCVFEAQKSYIFRKLTVVERVLMALCAICGIDPGFYTDIFCYVIFI